MHASLRLAAFLFAASSAGTAGAQPRHATSAQSTLVSGAAQVSRGITKGEDDTSWSYFFAPTHLYFLRDRLAVGGSLAVSRRTDNRSEVSFAGVGPAVRYYLGTPGGGIQPYLGGASLFGRGRVSAKTRPTQIVERIERTRMLDGFGGLLFMPSRQVGVAVELFHQQTTVRLPDLGGAQAAHSETGLRVAFAAFLIP